MGRGCFAVTVGIIMVLQYWKIRVGGRKAVTIYRYLHCLTWNTPPPVAAPVMGLRRAFLEHGELPGRGI